MSLLLHLLLPPSLTVNHLITTLSGLFFFLINFAFTFPTCFAVVSSSLVSLAFLRGQNGEMVKSCEMSGTRSQMKSYCYEVL